MVKIPREGAKEVFKPEPLSVQPKISEIFLRNQMERTGGRVRLQGNRWFSPHASMTSCLATDHFGNGPFRFDPTGIFGTTFEGGPR